MPRMRWIFLWMAAGIVYLLFANQSEARPVLLELFTSSSQCTNCQYAQEAAAKLRQEFPADDFLLLVYQLNKNDPDWTLEGAVRAIQYSIKETALPVAYFNGVAHINGADKKIYNSYLNQYRQRQADKTIITMQSQAVFHSDQLTTILNYRFLEDTAMEDYAINMAVSENRSEDQPSVMRHFEWVQDATQALSGEISLQIDLSKSVREVDAEVIWWIENSTTHEIIYCIRAGNIAPFQLDANQDGQWDKFDVFFLPFIWRTNASYADWNGDDRVNQADLLQFMEK